MIYLKLFKLKRLADVVNPQVHGLPK